MNKYFRFLVTLYVLSFVSKILYLFTHLTFAQDQVRDVLFIRDLISQGNFYIPFGPSTSVGNFFLPPLYYYLQLLSHLLFFDSFYSMDILVIIIESFTPIIIFFLMLKITKHKIISFLTSLIYIFSPAVLIASYSWNPNLIPFFSTLLIFSSLSYLETKKGPLLGISLISFAMMLSLHFQWFVLLPLMLFLILYSFLNIMRTWKTFLITGLVVIVLFMPYLSREVQTNFENTTNAVGFLMQDDKVYERVRKPAYLTIFFPNFYQRTTFGNLFVDDWSKQYEELNPEIVIGALIFISILIVAAKFSWKQYKNKKKFLLHYLLVFLSMAITLRFYKGDKPDYYLYIFLQFISIFIGSATYFVLKNKKTVIQVAPLLLIVFLQLISVMRINRFNDYSSIKRLSEKIKETSEQKSLIILPTNQELEKPLRYYLKDEFFAIENLENSDNLILFCYKSQNCQKYVPNQDLSDNYFKYNNIDEKNFSFVWNENGNMDTSSKVITDGNYTINIVEIN